MLLSVLISRPEALQDVLIVLCQVDVVIRTVLCDLGEVCLNGMVGSEKEIARAMALKPATVWEQMHVEDAVYLRLLFQGRLSEDEYWRTIIEKSGYPAHVDGVPTPEFLKSAMRKNFTKIPGTADVIKAVKEAGYTVGLISDHAREWVAYCEQQFPELAELFGVRCYSFDCGCTKKHPESFLHALGRLGADPATTLLIDDNEKNGRVAQAHPVNIRYFHRFVDARALRRAFQDYNMLPATR